MDNLNDLARVYLKLDRQIKALKKQQAIMEQRIMEQVPVDTSVITEEDQILIDHTEYELKRFHPSLLKEEFPDVFEKFNLLKTYNKLRIS
jgi:hypothetical protein